MPGPVPGGRGEDGLPPVFVPMLPTLVRDPFDSPDHLFEVKWDGIRVLCFCSTSGTRLYSRTGREATHQYPEFADLHTRLGGGTAVLDGEIVALDGAGRPSFELLQSRMNLARPAEIARAVGRVPLDLVLFDLVFRSGDWLGGRPLTERLDRLSEGVRFGDRVLRSEAIAEHGCALFEAARAQGLEGVVGKARASHYLPGRRSRDWLKVKVVHDVDLVVGGFTPGANSRAGSLGALLVGAYDEQGGLQYLGSVGTGFTDRLLASLTETLAGLTSADCPFAGAVPAAGARWVRPVLVARVEYRELTRGRRLRAPSFKGLRTDKTPQECGMTQLGPGS